MSEQTGYVEWSRNGTPLRTWYRVVGDIHSFPAPALVLHGGPAVTRYMDTHATLATKHGVPVIIYEQVGGGRSTHLADKPTSFFSVDLFKDEIDAVLAHFGIAQSFSLVGHSWGGMLSAEYAATRQPAGLKKLVIADAPARMEGWFSAGRKLLECFPNETRDAILKHEEEDTMDHPAYEKALQEFQQKHICQVSPWPQEILDGLACVRKDPTVVRQMAGPYEFKIIGLLRDWSVENLDKIRAPTLLINGVDDQAQDEEVAPFFWGIPKVKWVQFAHSSHMPFFEEPDRYFEVVSAFVKA